MKNLNLETEEKINLLVTFIQGFVTNQAVHNFH